MRAQFSECAQQAQAQTQALLQALHALHETELSELRHAHALDDEKWRLSSSALTISDDSSISDLSDDDFHDVSSACGDGTHVPLGRSELVAEEERRSQKRRMGLNLETNQLSCARDAELEAENAARSNIELSTAEKQVRRLRAEVATAAAAAVMSEAVRDAALAPEAKASRRSTTAAQGLAAAQRRANEASVVAAEAIAMCDAVITQGSVRR